MGGQTGPNPLTANTEEWNNTCWAEVADLNVAKRGGGMAGISTSALFFSGASTTVQNLTTTEEWDGTSWSEVADLPSGKKFPGSDGTSVLALGAGGYNPGTPYSTNSTDEWTSAIAAQTIAFD